MSSCFQAVWILFDCVSLFQVRTLFVSGLPMDAKPRELYLLFRAYEVRLGKLRLIGSAFGSHFTRSFYSDWALIRLLLF